MTGKEQDELGRLQAAHDYELIEYVEGLLEAEHKCGYNKGYGFGWNDGFVYASWERKGP